ncbi:efflux RND transporter periplasmic adaptor subunit [Phaeospirillum tilakii]|uniref:Efflux RND transporter periplasmic adaptor subunit n=1 Tax=Phaeospirillum tilakii TaxID=741673 RepID=A0ABW5CGR8_9PROT
MNRRERAAAALVLAGLATGGGWWLTTRPEPPPPPAAADAAPPPAPAEAESGIAMSPEAMRRAGIVIAPLLPRPVPALIRAPGEVVSNRFGAGVVTPPTTGTLIERRVAAGDRVRQGQVVGTMFSPEMAEAQGQFLIADREWRRVRDLGREIVSARRYDEAEAQRRQAMTRLIGFGLSPRQIETPGAAPSGQVALVAPRDGVVATDAVAVGELVAPGRVLFTIADERTAWIQARVSPAQAAALRPGQAATLRWDGQTRPAAVRALEPAIDPVTRTVGVRLDTANQDGALRAGLFVEVELPVDDGGPVLALPVESVLRGPDGDWRVYVAGADGRLRPVEVTLVRGAGTLAVIEGLAPGSPVVTEGAFFVQSEAAKGGFDPHGH